MRAILREHNDNRAVWVADSFQGVPKPETEQDKDLNLWTCAELTVPLDKVMHNFELYDLLDENVKFLIGWFKDTLPIAPIEKLALLRCDGDLYKSTKDALENLYPKLSPGGYCVIDDYFLVPCSTAVEEYRDKMGIKDPEVKMTTAGVYWRKS
jgi:hypothetical protein